VVKQASLQQLGQIYKWIACGRRKNGILSLLVW